MEGKREEKYLKKDQDDQITVFYPKEFLKHLPTSRIFAIMRKPNQKAKKDDVILILRGSGLFIDIKAPHTGEIAKIPLKKGQKVKVGDQLFSMKNIAKEPLKKPKKKHVYPDENELEEKIKHK